MPRIILQMLQKQKVSAIIRTHWIRLLRQKDTLQTIERNPDLPPITPYNTLDAFLNEYIGRMRDKVIAIKIKERDLGGDRFPRAQ
jgi:hypothetical protein